MNLTCPASALQGDGELAVAARDQHSRKVTRDQAIKVRCAPATWRLS